jgi:hypothetical protein
VSLAVWKTRTKPTLLYNTGVAHLHITSGMHDWVNKSCFELCNKCCKYFGFLPHILQSVGLDFKVSKISQIIDVSYFSRKILFLSHWCSYLDPISNMKNLSGNILKVSKIYISLNVATESVK